MGLVLDFRVWKENRGENECEKEMPMKKLGLWILYLFMDKSVKNRGKMRVKMINNKGYEYIAHKNDSNVGWYELIS